MGVLHQWRNETSQLVETKQTTVNQFFYFFNGKTTLKPISYVKILATNMSMAKTFMVKIPDTYLVI